MAAQQLCVQLGILPPKQIQPSIDGSAYSDQLPDYGGKISEMIDSENSGNRVLMTALGLAEQITEGIQERRPKAVVIIAPRFGFAWEVENELFIEFLVTGLRDTDSRCILAFADSRLPDIPGRWKINWMNGYSTTSNQFAEPSLELLTLIPGVIEPRIAETIMGTAPMDQSRYLQLANGSILVAPEYRRNPEKVDKSALDELGQKSESFPWLSSYCQLYGNLQYLNVYFLRQQASQRFAEGAVSTAFRLIHPVLQYSFHPVHKATAMINAQAMRVALMKWDDAAAIPDPPHRVPPFLRGALLQSKAWGLVMMDQPEKAEPYFDEARQLLKQFPSRFYLYVLNISALNKLKLDQVETALELEREIEQTLSANSKKDWHLEYINSLNLARLFRKTGKFELAEEYYSKAFSTSDGLRGASDLVYTNINWAHLYKDKNPERSFLHWFRAALHWAATDVPEALSARVTLPIIGHSVPAGGGLPEAVSNALISFLYKAAKAAGMSFNVFEGGSDSLAASSRQITFTHATSLSGGAIDCAFGCQGWSVLGTKLTLKARFGGKYYDRLNALLVRIIEEWCPASATNDFKTLIVDSTFGSEMPATIGELTRSCVRLKVPRLHFGVNKSVTLSAAEFRTLEKKAIVRLGPAVANLDDVEDRLRVHFKRYREPLTLSEQESGIVRVIDGMKRVEDVIACSRNAGCDEDRALESLRSLETSRVIVIRTPENEVPELI